MTSGADASHANIYFAADIIYMRVNYYFVSKTKSEVFVVVENDMTLCPNE